jgi:hypothetical protein
MGLPRASLLFAVAFGCGREPREVDCTIDGLAARVFVPAEPRFEPVPVVVVVPGGVGRGQLGDGATATYEADGIVTIAFVMPDDDRGDDSARAVVDVLRFVAGTTTAMVDGRERTLEDIVRADVDETNLGLFGQSNGGNLAVVALADHGSDGPRVAWYASYETPVMAQFVTHEVAGTEPHGGNPDVFDNPAYVAHSCTPEGCDVDESLGRLDASRPVPVSETGDSGGDQRSTVCFREGEGCPDGAFDLSPRVLTAFPELGRTVSVLSIPLSTALEARYGGPDGLHANGLASADEAAAFWAARDPVMTGRFRTVIAGNPDLRVLVVALTTDHSMRASDHADVAVQYAAWQDAGAAWLRLDPDCAYLAADPCVENPADASFDPEDFDRGPGIDDPGPAGEILPHNERGDGVDVAAMRAAVAELADRAHAGDWSADLDGPLR